MQNLLSELKELLKQDDRLHSDDDLLKNKIIELTLKSDNELLNLLLSNETIKKHFFTEINDILIFDKEKFIKFVNNKEFLPDSYTSFKNKIGLTVNDEYISAKKGVLLVWPYKDCILEGGQTKEDAKRNEIFWNETIAPDEIDRLLDPKVLTSFLRINKDGEEELDKIKDEDNLVIRGNNLLALHSLKKRFLGKIKLIYIDPPYNTDNDSFNYNDSFNHSTYLTFMKNRLEIAKELLRDDGVLFVSCDDNEYTYLKVLLDELFHRDNFQNIFHIKVRHEDRILRADIKYQKVVEQLLCYSKSGNFQPNRRVKPDSSREEYSYVVKTCQNPDSIVEIAGYQVEIYKEGQYKIIRDPESIGALKEYNIRGSLITQSGSASEFYERFLRDRKSTDGLGTLYKVIGMGIRGDGLGYRFIRQPFDESGRNGFYYQGRPLKASLDSLPYPNFYDMVTEFNQVANEGGVQFRNGKKPEKFISKIFEISNLKDGDIILDFFVGSGSTVAVAHKYGFQYIGIEQLDYGENDCVTRLKNVINGDETGISQEVEWSGGNDFVYCELMKQNEYFVDEIEEANEENINELWNKIKDCGFLSYKVDLNAFNENASDFDALSFDDKKRFLLEVLDKNQLYVNLSEIDDTDYKVNETDKLLNRYFYKI